MVYWAWATLVLYCKSCLIVTAAATGDLIDTWWASFSFRGDLTTGVMLKKVVWHDARVWEPEALVGLQNEKFVWDRVVCDYWFLVTVSDGTLSSFCVSVECYTQKLHVCKKVDKGKWPPVSVAETCLGLSQAWHMCVLRIQFGAMNMRTGVNSHMNVKKSRSSVKKVNHAVFHSETIFPAVVFDVLPILTSSSKLTAA